VTPVDTNGIPGQNTQQRVQRAINLFRLLLRPAKEYLKGGQPKMEQNKLYDNLDKIEKALSDGLEAEITEVSETTSFKFYNRENFEDRKGLKVVCTGKDDLEISQFFTVTDHVQGLKQSNLYAFKERYGKWPVAGMKVQLKLDEEGFWRIDY